MALLELFRSTGRPSAKNRDVWAATTQVLREMIPACPACDSALDGHAYSQVAEAGNEQDIRHLLDALERKDWRELVGIHSFEGMKNAVIVTAIRCPKGTGSVLPYADYVELYFPSERGTSVVLSDEEWRNLADLLPTLDWHTF